MARVIASGKRNRHRLRLPVEKYRVRGSNSRPYACEAYVIATTPTLHLSGLVWLFTLCFRNLRTIPDKDRDRSLAKSPIGLLPRDV